VAHASLLAEQHEFRRGTQFQVKLAVWLVELDLFPSEEAAPVLGVGDPAP
jgi:hypothetical protein